MGNFYSLACFLTPSLLGTLLSCPFPSAHITPYSMPRAAGKYCGLSGSKHIYRLVYFQVCVFIVLTYIQICWLLILSIINLWLNEDLGKGEGWWSLPGEREVQTSSWLGAGGSREPESRKSSPSQRLQPHSPFLSGVQQDSSAREPRGRFADDSAATAKTTTDGTEDSAEGGASAGLLDFLRASFSSLPLLTTSFSRTLRS